MTNIIVLNAYDYRWEKYKDNPIYQRFKPTYYKDISQETLSQYVCKCNPREELFRKIVSCAEGHKGILRKIVADDLKDVVILEDDGMFDLSRLHELKGLKDFTYLGGMITSLVMKHEKEFIKDKREGIINGLSHGLNEIENENYRINLGLCYFIPNKDIAQKILDHIPIYKKNRAIDIDFMLLQKKGIIKDFIFPAIATQNIEEANKGFTYSRYKMKDIGFKY